MGFHPVGFRIEFVVGLAEEPVLSVTYARREVQVLCQCEVRKTDLEVVCHTILELVHEAVFHEFRGLEADFVL